MLLCTTQKLKEKKRKSRTPGRGRGGATPGKKVTWLFLPVIEVLNIENVLSAETCMFLFLMHLCPAISGGR